ncbi:MAG TPA: FGGY family carbohydrate kinase, partial [Acidimicrobiales bacterium]|nr:FGGY family carbohydrate kinase [Acidimicrobiales bacterium]
MPLVAGVDCSTQSTKVLIVEADSGAVVASGSAPNIVTGEGRARETAPQVWADALATALGQTGLAGQVAAVSVGGQQHGLVVLDRSGAPVRPAPLWHDTRSAPDAIELVTAIGGPAETARRTGSVLNASFTITHWAWLRRCEPDAAARACQVMLPHDYLNFCLTGTATTDRSDASGTGWWSPPTGQYDLDILALGQVDLPPEALPAVAAPDAAAGAVTAQAAERFGLAPGTGVACGSGDNAAAALALALVPGEMAMSLGTSGTAYTASTVPSTDPTGIVAGFAGAQGGFLPLVCTINATLAVDRTASWLGLDREDVLPSDGVVYLPWLGGERSPAVPTATGGMSGLRYDTEPASVLQAAYEGVVATLLAAAGELARWSPSDMSQPLLLLGGGAKGKTWQATVQRL